MNTATTSKTACLEPRDVPANWREFVSGVLTAVKEARRAANRKGTRKQVEALESLYERLDSAQEIANLRGGRGPRAGHWVEQAYLRACAVKRLLEAEHGTVSAD